MPADNPWILLAEASAALAGEYKAMLAPQGLDIRVADNAPDILSQCRERPALLILDLGLPQKMDGLAILETLRREGVMPRTIVMTGNASVNTAVRAMQLGARDFLIKPFTTARLLQAVQAELERPEDETMPPDMAGVMPGRAAEDHNSAAAAPRPAEPGEQRTWSGFIGTSPRMQAIYTQIEHAARSNATVFITGESGTGKEVCARAIHSLSARAARPFIPINCAAIPRDLMESELFGHVKGAFTGAVSDRDGAATLAHGGTLFLDEIAEMTLAMQTKLLRFLQDLAFMKVGGSKLEHTDIRIVCATNRDPLAEIRGGNFREDLFYRLYVVPIDMPPLRERGEDVIDIALGLLNRYGAEEGKHFTGYAPDAEHALRQYSWPGNIRQLQNVIRHAVVMHDSGTVTARMLPATLLHTRQQSTNGAAAPFTGDQQPQTGGSRTVIRPLAEVEREVIEHAISLYGGNIARAATALGVSPSTIYRKKAAWEAGMSTEYQEENLENVVSFGHSEF
jgi:two-component system repressor protein LuxO